jgi:hypothetical protein
MAFVLVSDCVNSIETLQGHCWNSASIARMIQAELELLNAQYIVEQDIRFIKLIEVHGLDRVRIWTAHR